MSKEKLVSNEELQPLAQSLFDAFFQRRDLYARQLSDGNYICIHEPLRLQHVLAHLQGTLTLGTYVLDAQSCARFVVLDADDDEQWLALSTLSQTLADQAVPCYLETSRRGGHLWFFFEEPIPAQQARAFGAGLLARYRMSEMEVFPKQDRLQDGPGSLIRLPFGVHQKSGQRYGFTHPDGTPLAPRLRDQLPLLCAAQTVPHAALCDWVEVGMNSNSPPVSDPPETLGDTLASRLKEVVSVADFVGRFVQLTPQGRGLCPFHDDRHVSFSVNLEKNYWHCFAGCGGGSIIDFWMKFRGCDFKTAMKDLSKMLFN